MPDLSVVIPTFERAAGLERLLRSLAQSELADLEMQVVVVDDGSRDATPEVVARSRLPVCYLCQRNSGPAIARNRGWRAATSPLVLFLDDDVVVEPGTVRAMVVAAESADAVGANVVPFGKPGLVAGFMHVEGLSNHKVVDGEVRYLATAGALFRRTDLEALDGFDESFPAAAGEDADLSFRMRSANRTLTVAPTATVLHEYRSSVRQLVRTYYRHGTVQPLLRQRHADRGEQLRASARERADPRSWLGSYRRYRSQAGPARSCVWLVLRAAMMVPWLCGAMIASRRAVTSGEER